MIPWERPWADENDAARTRTAGVRLRVLRLDPCFSPFITELTEGVMIGEGRQCQRERRQEAQGTVGGREVLGGLGAFGSPEHACAGTLRRGCRARLVKE